MAGWWRLGPRGRYAASGPRFEHPIAGTGLAALALAAVLAVGVHPAASGVEYTAAAPVLDLTRPEAGDVLTDRSRYRSSTSDPASAGELDALPDLGTVLISTVATPVVLHSGFVKPVDGVVTSVFGLRFHPILHVWKVHTGLDLSAACGVPVQAVKDGTVSFAGYAGGYGNRVVIDHGGGLSTAYGHLTAFAAVAGLAVKQGQIIGYVGSTGLSTGCHLHFEVLVNGAFVDPAPFLDLAPAPTVTIPPALAPSSGSASPSQSPSPTGVPHGSTTSPATVPTSPTSESTTPSTTTTSPPTTTTSPPTTTSSPPTTTTSSSTTTSTTTSHSNTTTSSHPLTETPTTP